MIRTAIIYFISAILTLPALGGYVEVCRKRAFLAKDAPNFYKVIAGKMQPYNIIETKTSFFEFFVVENQEIKKLLTPSWQAQIMPKVDMSSPKNELILLPYDSIHYIPYIMPETFRILTEQVVTYQKEPMPIYDTTSKLLKRMLLFEHKPETTDQPLQ